MAAVMYGIVWRGEGNSSFKIGETLFNSRGDLFKWDPGVLIPTNLGESKRHFKE